MPTLSEALAIALEHHRAGRLELAQEICQRILRAEPRHADALHLLGLVAYGLGQHDVAVRQIREAIAIQPDVAAYHNNLGEVCRAMQRFSEAIGCYQRAVAIAPQFAAAYANLGNVLKKQGRLDEAVPCYQRAIEFSPGIGEIHNSLGITFAAQGKLDEAIRCYRRSLELAPSLAAAHNNLGAALHSQRRVQEATGCYRRAVELEPGFAEAHINLASALLDMEQLDEAADCCRLALQIKPDFPVIYSTLARLRETQGDVEQAADCYRRMLESSPGGTETHSNCLRLLRYRPEMTAADLKAAHVEYDVRHASGLRAEWRPHSNAPEPDRPLRLGFVSPSLSWPLGSFLLGAMEHLDPSQCTVALYSDRALPEDDVTARFKGAAAIWRDVFGLSDAQLAECVRADCIDVLFDLAGHTPRNRLLVFARKPAPIQVTWADSCGTTGLSAIDYLLSDRHLIPAGSETHYVERVLRMPDGYVCYDPLRTAPDVGPLPAFAQGHVTFGSFSRPAKIGPQVIHTWARILRRVPGARLTLQHHGLADRGVQQRFGELFRAQGVAPERLEFEGYSGTDAYFEKFRRTDITLDPFPFCGGLTTCDSLWMGVPVITCPGEGFASRQSLGHLRNVGLPETIAGDVDDYVERAVNLAGDLPRLAAMRAGLREQMAASPLCDAPRFAANLTALLRSVWREWCART